MVEAQLDDPTVTIKSQGSAVSDKFGIIFNIDVRNFSVGDFLTLYNNNGNLNTVLTGQMAFPIGHADLWYVDIANIGYNATGKAQDEFISTGIASDGSSYQDVYVSVWYGNIGHSMAYRIFFVRNLTTQDANDAQFNQNGFGIYYAISSWDDSSTYYHLSSFDQMVILGDSIAGGQNSTVTQYVIDNQTQTITQVSSQIITQTTTQTINQGTNSFSQSIINTSSSFTLFFVLIGLILAIPFISRKRSGKLE